VTLGNIRELGLHHLIASCLSQLGGRALPPNRPDTVSRETFVHLVWMSDVVFRLSFSQRHLSHYEIRSARSVEPTRRVIINKLSDLKLVVHGERVFAGIGVRQSAERFAPVVSAGRLTSRGEIGKALRTPYTQA